MNEWFARRVREGLVGPDQERAQSVEVARVRSAEARAVPTALRAEIAALEKHPEDAIELGSLSESRGAAQTFLVAVRSVLCHLLFTGASGAGKTFLLLQLLVAVLRRDAVGSITVFDFKGELAELLTTRVFPGLAAKMPTPEREAFLKRLVVIDPFATDYLPPLDLLVRDPSIPITVQAQDIAECFESAIDAGSGVRMETILHWTLRLCIELGGSFHVVRRALEEPLLLEALARRSKDHDVMRYFLLRYPQEPKASKLALLARLDRFLALPATRRCLGARACVSFDTLLRDRITVVNLGRADAGMHSVTKFFATVLLTRFVRAVFRRPHHGTRPALLVSDEWQVGLTPALATEWEDVLALARSRNVFAWLCNQQLVQLDKHSPELRKIVLAQTGIHAAFRMAAEDAHAMKSMLPTTGAVPRARREFGDETRPASAYLSVAEEREARAEAAIVLPPRAAYLFDKRKPWGGVLLRTATVTLPETKNLSRDLVERTTRGMLALPVGELDRQLALEEDALNQLLRPTPLAKPPAPAPTPAPARPAPPKAAQAPIAKQPPVAPASPPPPADAAAPPGRRRRRGKGVPALG